MVSIEVPIHEYFSGPQNYNPELQTSYIRSMFDFDGLDASDDDATKEERLGPRKRLRVLGIKKGYPQFWARGTQPLGQGL